MCMDKIDMIDKKLTHLKRVISSPDKYNANLSSKDRVESMESLIDELKEDIKELSSRMDGQKYLITNLIGRVYSLEGK